MSDHDDLEGKIAQAKIRLSLPELFAKLGLSDHAKRSGRCPFPGHEDKHPSFSVFKGNDGFWHWKCQAGCGEGDEITFLSKLKGVSRGEAMSQYLELAGFPRSRPPLSRECPESRCVAAFPASRALPESPESPKSPESPASPASRGFLALPEYPVSLVSPASEGQAVEGDIEQELKRLAACNACTARKSAKTRRFKLARELATIQMREGRKLAPSEVTTACREWFERSRPFLEAKETFEEHLTALIAEMAKARVATGKGALERAIAKVSNLSLSDLPAIPDWPDAHETWRRLAAIHRELSAANGGNTHFLSYRDAAEAISVSPKYAYNITAALAGADVIKIVDKGQAGTNRRKAAEFLYLLSISEEDGLIL